MNLNDRPIAARRKPQGKPASLPLQTTAGPSQQKPFGMTRLYRAEKDRAEKNDVIPNRAESPVRACPEPAEGNLLFAVDAI
jgi:hypothetical protein